MNKNQLYKIEASIEVGKNREVKPVNIDPIHACGRHKAAAMAWQIIYEKFPMANRVIVNVVIALPA